MSKTTSQYEDNRKKRDSRKQLGCIGKGGYFKLENTSFDIYRMLWEDGCRDCHCIKVYSNTTREELKYQKFSSDAFVTPVNVNVQIIVVEHSE